VVESNNQVQSQRDYLPLLDTLTNQAKQQTNTLHIGTHILSESSKDNTQSAPAESGLIHLVSHGARYLAPS
jgi:insecticidal toxin complex protein TccC